MTRTVTIKTPPTFFVTDGPDLTFELPLVPKPKRPQIALFILLLASLFIFLSWVILGRPIFIFALSVLRGESAPAFPFGSLVVAAMMIPIFAVPVDLLYRLAITLFSVAPALEVRAEGLADRRVLKRLVRWDEFEGVENRRNLFNPGGRLSEFSFRLKDPGLRRFSPCSAFQSFLFGGKRVAIIAMGFDVPPEVILDVILKMIRTERQEYAELPR